MTFSNALKRMAKIGKVYRGDVPQHFKILIGNNELTVSRNGGELSNEVATISVRRLNDISDPLSDYHAGSFFDNLKQAIEWAEVS